MAWFALARVFFAAAVAYAAALLQPLPYGPGLNIAFGLALASLAILFEHRLRDTAATRFIGGLLGVVVGLAIARAIETGFYWLDNGDRRVEFMDSFLLIV